MSKEKAVNYSDDVVANMTSVYQNAGQELSVDGDAKRQSAMEEIQAETGKSMHSIRAKLGQIGIYIPKQKPTKKGGTRTTKANLIAIVADNGNEVDGFFDSLESANKTVIEYVIRLQDALDTE